MTGRAGLIGMCRGDAALTLFIFAPPRLLQPPSTPPRPLPCPRGHVLPPPPFWIRPSVCIT
ncbi:hypothetical protein E2C01_086360 [Portunus trituberculatus]|uniref:Uncharacterized protein n=1 Tax=Portunus trituberculatus TaxID=210409 RepID=A0A5B7JA38_PORTR|nr:hypothetical protein [Portunus trituberculatus]